MLAKTFKPHSIGKERLLTRLGRKLPIGGRRHSGSLNTATASGLIKREIK